MFAGLASPSPSLAPDMPRSGLDAAQLPMTEVGGVTPSTPAQPVMMPLTVVAIVVGVDSHVFAPDSALPSRTAPLLDPW